LIDQFNLDPPEWWISKFPYDGVIPNMEEEEEMAKKQIETNKKKSK
jgi:hypothetical protein